MRDGRQDTMGARLQTDRQTVRQTEREREREKMDDAVCADHIQFCSRQFEWNDLVEFFVLLEMITSRCG